MNMFADISVEHELKARIKELRDRAELIWCEGTQTADVLGQIAKNWAVYNGYEKEEDESMPTDSELLNFWTLNPQMVTTLGRKFRVWDREGHLVDEFDTARLAIKAAMVVALMPR